MGAVPEERYLARPRLCRDGMPISHGGMRGRLIFVEGWRLRCGIVVGSVIERWPWASKADRWGRGTGCVVFAEGSIDQFEQRFAEVVERVGAMQESGDQA